MAVKLHRCSLTWLKVDAHACWRVQKALDEADVDYELVEHPMRRGKRIEVERLSGQKVLPVIEREDGSTYREDSQQMAERIRAGELTPGAPG